MADNKTKPTTLKALDYLENIDNEQRKADCLTLNTLMKEITGEQPIMWGTSIVGYGSYHYKYESGREGDMPLIGFSNRKQSITIYIISGFAKCKDQLEKIGKYKVGKSCFYIKKLSDIDVEILTEMIISSIEVIKNKYQ
tara:strand:- start:5411 stop:5827 length:417 start_codon:yes stop_codon:yes gene_type:complete